MAKPRSGCQSHFIRIAPLPASPFRGINSSHCNSVLLNSGHRPHEKPMFCIILKNNLDSAPRSLIYTQRINVLTNFRNSEIHRKLRNIQRRKDRIAETSNGGFPEEPCNQLNETITKAPAQPGPAVRQSAVQ